jgi:Na+-transporting NADH:ubiquinone oxidoreductase subunit A
MPKIAGRPSGAVDDLTIPEKLLISLQRGDESYNTIVKNGQKIKFGDPIAEADISGGKIFLPAPVSGKVVIPKKNDEESHHIILESIKDATPSRILKKLEPERSTEIVVRETLARYGIWPFFWSSKTDGIPSLDTSDRPRTIIVNSVLAEPFRTRGKVILQRSWDRIVHGIKFLSRLMQDYGTTEIILTDKRDPVAKKLYSELTGFAWLHFHPVPLLYPVENPKILSKALRKHYTTFKKTDIIWVIDIQGVEAIGACLLEGLPLHQRTLALGGPGFPDPRHISARIGTPIKYLLPKNFNTDRVLILRGGLLKGEPVVPELDAVGYDDDAFFFLPKMKEREFLSFTRPGFKRTSILPCFMSRITGATDSEITDSLRGERRPCIACGLCEMVCPANLMPQVIHRYLYREDFDKAEVVGLNLCVDCGLCTYVCPSKIELQQQFMEALEQIRWEHEEAASSQSSSTN